MARDEPRLRSDFSSFTVKLRDGVTWSDGKPFTADDVVYTLEMLIANGKGKKDLVQSASVADAVKGVTKIDPLTVKIDLTQPDPRFAFSYLINYFDIGLQWLPAHIWKDVEDVAAFRFFDLAEGLAGDDRPLEGHALHRQPDLHGPALATGGRPRQVLRRCRPWSASSPSPAARATAWPS